MNFDTQQVVLALNMAFLKQHPNQARVALNQLTIDDLVELINSTSLVEVNSLWDRLMPDTAARLLPRLSEDRVQQILQRGEPVHTARVLARHTAEQQETLFAHVNEARKRELQTLVQYPENSAGSLMDQRFLALTEDLTVREALSRIKKFKPRFTRQLYTIDQQGVVQGMLELHKLTFADPATTLSEIQTKPVIASVYPTATRDEVVAQLESHRITDLPVVDLSGRLIGSIHHDMLLEAMRQAGSADMLRMVGASRDERALSSIGFVVRKRLPWLSINLLTAFLAAAVVGLFESTIAQFTALAVLLPVVAGQSGNTGAQALAVTMRGLALREIGTSQWVRVARKEIGASFINGIAIALMTSLGVLLWSSSTGLALIIGMSMVIAMVAAALSGVIIPVVLSSLGQDPASSSSIILTTVTDVVGFFAFLGIATTLSAMI